jgi:hypothetical protein
MTIKNIWSNFEKIANFLNWKTALTSLFTWWIYAWKPIDVSTELSLYFSLSSNNAIVRSDRTWKKTLKKRAIIEFVLIANTKSIPEADFYEALDTLSNELVWSNYNMDWFKVDSIDEETQSWILYDTNENPLIIANYQFIYTSEI